MKEREKAYIKRVLEANNGKTNTLFFLDLNDLH